MDKHDDARAMGLATDRTRMTTCIMFSMPARVNGEAVKDVVRAVAAQEFGGRHDFVMALHTDTKHPHVHLTVRTVADDGTKLNHRKADLQHLGDTFAGKLRRRGIEAESTPRHARGVTRRGEVTPVYRIRQRGKVPNTDARKVREVRRDLEDHSGRLPKQPWDRALVARRERVSDCYRRASHVLQQSGLPEDRQLARALEVLVSDLALIRTQRKAIAQTLTPDLGLSDRHQAAQPSQTRQFPQVNEKPKPDRSR